MCFKHLQKIWIITVKKEYNFSLLSKARETKNPLHLKVYSTFDRDKNLGQ